MSSILLISRHGLIAGFGFGAAATLLPHFALAAFPDHLIRLIVPFAPGGNADIVGRFIGERISSVLSQSVVVDNRDGAGGGISAEVAAHAGGDGNTLLVSSNGPLTVNPFVRTKLGYDTLKDFAPIALTSCAPHTIVLSNSVAAKSVAELIAQSKKVRIRSAPLASAA